MCEYDCPSCNRAFDSRRGLGVHHSRTHGERLPNRECDRCGEQFYCEYERKYCSEECKEEAVSYVGEANPNDSGGKRQTECEICGSEFDYNASEKPGLFCSDCVENEQWRNPPVITGSDHPRWNGGKLTLACDECGVPVERYPNQVTGEVTLCSRECHASWLSDEFTGEGHPNWRGGGNADYGKGWNAIRERALKRDGHECVHCGATADELGRNPDVHHVVPVRVFVETPVLTEQDAHTLDNVVSLCPACHRRAEFGHVSRVELRWRAGIGQGWGWKTVASPSSSAL